MRYCSRKRVTLLPHIQLIIISVWFYSLWTFFFYYYSIPSLYVNINKHPQLLPAVSTPAAVPETHNQLTSLPFIIIFNPEHLHTPVKNKQTVRACNKTQAVMNHQKTCGVMRGQRSHSGAEPPTGQSWYCRATIWRKNRKNKQPVGSAGQTEWKSALKAATISNLFIWDDFYNQPAW